ncbi:MAG: hypothetical protein IJW19_05155 [Clostridia bacterium]|nr:hypothetical protein [Clostridia bacterium]
MQNYKGGVMADKYKVKTIVDKNITATVHIPILTEEELKQRRNIVVQAVRNIFTKKEDQI